MKTMNELYICFLLSLTFHVGLMWAGLLNFHNFRDKPFEVEFRFQEESLPNQYQIAQEKEIVEPLNQEVISEEIADKIDPEPEEKEAEFEKSLLRYQDSVKQRIQKEKRYSRWALRLSREGAVRIFFILRPSGEIKNIRLLRSSGIKDLDAEALDAVKRASPFFPFPDGIGKKELEFEIDIIFKITKDNGPA